MLVRFTTNGGQEAKVSLALNELFTPLIWIKFVLMIESVQPKLSVIFNLTVYKPFWRYACVGFALDALLPSPKDQL